MYKRSRNADGNRFVVLKMSSIFDSPPRRMLGKAHGFERASVENYFQKLAHFKLPAYSPKQMLGAFSFRNIHGRLRLPRSSPLNFRIIPSNAKVGC